MSSHNNIQVILMLYPDCPSSQRPILHSPFSENKLKYYFPGQALPLPFGMIWICQSSWTCLSMDVLGYNSYTQRNQFVRQQQEIFKTFHFLKIRFITKYQYIQAKDYQIHQDNFTSLDSLNDSSEGNLHHWGAGALEKEGIWMDSLHFFFFASITGFEKVLEGL